MNNITAAITSMCRSGTDSTKVCLSAHAVSQKMPCPEMLREPPRFAIVSLDKEFTDSIGKQHRECAERLEESPFCMRYSVLKVFSRVGDFTAEYRKKAFDLLVCATNMGDRELNVWKVADLMLNSSHSKNLIILALSDKPYVVDQECMICKPITFTQIYHKWRAQRDNAPDNHFRMIIRASEYEAGKDL